MQWAIKRSTFCTVKKIPFSWLNFPPHGDFEQHRARVSASNPACRGEMKARPKSR